MEFIELLRTTRKFDVENLKVISETECINYSEKFKRYTIYYLQPEGNYHYKIIHDDEFEALNKFKNL